jgi:hypothetical protein
MPPHLLVEISSHGFGHLAQVAPVLQTLRRDQSEIRITVRSLLPENLLKARIGGPVDAIRANTDVGMHMASVLDVDVAQSARAYKHFHRDWEISLAREETALATLAPDLVFCDVPYLPLMAAAGAGIPAIAMCSLHWGDIYRHYCGGRPEAAGIHGAILEAYRSARLFLQPQPHMPMPDLDHRQPIGPVALLGVNRRREIDQLMGLRGPERLVLVGLGGVTTRFPVESWPALDNVRWLVPADWGTTRQDFSPIETLEMAFVDLLCSVDLLITKPGYGAFVEAACHGIPVLYIRREDWPETPYLTDWLHRHGVALEIEREALESARLAEGVLALLEHPRREPVEPTGNLQAAKILAEHLR